MVRTFQAFKTRPSHGTKHTLPRLARSTLNDLQQNQHEKTSLVCAHVQSPSGLALVPCALSMVNLSGQYDVESHTHTEECFVFYFWHPILVRPVMKRLFFLGKPRKKRLASLARLMIIIIILVYTCLLYTSPSPRDKRQSRMPSSA